MAGNSYALFTFDVCVCVNVNFTVKLTLMQRMDSDPISVCLCLCDAKLNFDGDVDANTNADVKCEQSIRVDGSVVLTNRRTRHSSLCTRRPQLTVPHTSREVGPCL